MGRNWSRLLKEARQELTMLVVSVRGMVQAKVTQHPQVSISVKVL